MPGKKIFIALFLAVLFASGCELLRASQSKDIRMNDVYNMFHEDRIASPEKEQVTLPGEVRKMNEWFKDNLW